MKLDTFDRTVIMTVDRRYPAFADETAALLKTKGCNPEVFLNGRGVDGLDPSLYDLIHAGDPPADWTLPRAAWDYGQAYLTIVRQAFEQGVESLLMVEDDIELTPDCDAILARAAVPADWQILYYSPMLFWARKPPVPAGPYVAKLDGCEGFQAVAWRRAAMAALLEMEQTKPFDSCVSERLHHRLPTYGILPAVVRQATGVASTITPGEPFRASFVYDLA